MSKVLMNKLVNAVHNAMLYSKHKSHTVVPFIGKTTTFSKFLIDVIYLLRACAIEKNIEDTKEDSTMFSLNEQTRI